MTVAATAPRPTLLSGPLRVPTVGILSLITLVAFDDMAFGTVMPVVARDLDGLSLYAWAFSATFITSLFATVVAGGWADSRGPARPMLAGLGCFLAGLLMSACAPGMGLFVAGRAVQGLGSGAALVSLYVLIARVYPEELRPRVFSATAAAWVVPSLVGPAVAGFVAEWLSWRAVFFALPVLVTAATAMLVPVLRTAGGGVPRALRLPAAAAVAAGAALLLAGVDRTNPLLALVGLAGLGFGLPRLLPKGLLRSRAVLLRPMYQGAFFGAEAFVPLGLTRLHGYSPTVAGVVLTVGSLGWSAGSQVQGRSGRSRPFFAVLGMLLVAAGTAAVVLTLPYSGWIAWPGWVAAGTGMGMGLPAITVLVMNASAAQEQGANSSVLQISDSLSSALVVGLAGALVTGFQPLAAGLRAAGFLIAAIAGCGVLAALRVERVR